jgi:hypothetical protein
LLAEQKTADALGAVVTAMKSAPYRTQLRWAVVSLQFRSGCGSVAHGVASGAASPRLLQSIGIKNRIQAAKPRTGKNASPN